MKIGIDVSQLAHEKTGVAQYVQKLVNDLIQLDSKNEYILFFSSLRKQFPTANLQYIQGNKRVEIKRFLFPPTILNILWNTLHILPIEWLIGEVDVFISSDWVQPPVRKAKSITILYDLIVYKYPEETARNIVETQKRRLFWVKKECDKVLCISESTKKDAEEILGIDKSKLVVTYPGV
jgi:glycosyltransferase involved in cell wall biosynthesis